MNIFLTVAVFFLLYSADVNANDYSNSLKVQAKENKLYQNKAWFALGYYRKNDLREGYRSEVDNPEFFFPVMAQAILMTS